MDISEFNALESKLKEAREDDTPYLVAKDDNLMVVGDANKTEKKVHDFNVLFHLPQKFRSAFKDEDVLKEDDFEFVVEVEFKDVFVTPRDNIKITSEVATLMPFFNGVSDNGRLRDLTDEEKYEIVSSMNDDVVDAMYRIVGKILKIDDEMLDYVMFSSVMEVTMNFIDAFPGSI